MKEIQFLKDFQKNTGARVYLTGETARALIRKEQPSRWEVVVRSAEWSAIMKYLTKAGRIQEYGDVPGRCKVKPHSRTGILDIRCPRGLAEHEEYDLIFHHPDLSLSADACLAVLTVDVIYVPLEALDSKNHVNKELVVSTVSGLEHLSRKLASLAPGPGGLKPEERIQEDPELMLEVLVRLSEMGYRLEGRTFQAIKKNASLAKEAPPFAVRDALVRTLKTDKPSRSLKAMARTGVLKYVFPELAACVGCKQNPKYHSYPVFEHLVYATDAACTLTDRLDVRLATLCHDLGKAPTRAVREGGDGPDDVTFHNHEVVSTRLTYAFMKRLLFSEQFIKQVVQLVRHHQYKYDRSWTDKAVRRFIRATNITESDLDNLDAHPQFLVRQADRMGNDYKKDLPITPKQRDFQERIRQVLRGEDANKRDT